jgi:hypothetical protein
MTIIEVSSCATATQFAPWNESTERDCRCGHERVYAVQHSIVLIVCSAAVKSLHTLYLHTVCTAFRRTVVRVSKLQRAH